MENLFYIQDTTKTENGQVYWWKKNSFGHTSDLKKAETYTLKQAMIHYKNRNSDLPWPVEYILNKTKLTVEKSEINILQAWDTGEITLSDIEKKHFKEYHLNIDL